MISFESKYSSKSLARITKPVHSIRKMQQWMINLHVDQSFSSTSNISKVNLNSNISSKFEYLENVDRYYQCQQCNHLGDSIYFSKNRYCDRRVILASFYFQETRTSLQIIWTKWQNLLVLRTIALLGYILVL